jgi:hypothetical protein
VLHSLYDLRFSRYQKMWNSIEVKRLQKEAATGAAAAAAAGSRGSSTTLRENGQIWLSLEQQKKAQEQRKKRRQDRQGAAGLQWGQDLVDKWNDEDAEGGSN